MLADTGTVWFLKKVPNIQEKKVLSNKNDTETHAGYRCSSICVG